jgi:hypothetical protein
MKKLLVIGLAVSLFFSYAIPLLACDCDTAAALQLGLKDRLHQPWPGDPQGSGGKAKSIDNGPKQESQPMNMNQDAKQQGEVKK